jgi:hypothetical protein
LRQNALFFIGFRPKNVYFEALLVSASVSSAAVAFSFVSSRQSENQGPFLHAIALGEKGLLSGSSGLPRIIGSQVLLSLAE